MKLFFDKLFLNPSLIAKKLLKEKTNNKAKEITSENEMELANNIVKHIINFNLEKTKESKEKIKISALDHETVSNIKKEKTTMIIDVINKYIPIEEKQILIATFKYYCSLSDSNNYILMSLNSITRFIKDCGLMKTSEMENKEEVPLSEGKINILKRS